MRGHLYPDFYKTLETLMKESRQPQTKVIGSLPPHATEDKE